MQIIPAIDIIDGKCVRLTEGDYLQKSVYDASPLEMAKKYEQHGIKRLHVVDLDGAKAGKVLNWRSIEAISMHTNLEIDFRRRCKNKRRCRKDYITRYTICDSWKHCSKRACSFF